jgi:hypothetical protein
VQTWAAKEDGVEIVPVESAGGRLAREFIELPHRIYRGCAQWVPQFRADIRAVLARKNPFFETGAAAFFLAIRGGKTVGSIAAFDNAAFNEYHKTRIGHFHFLDLYDDREAAHGLVGAASEWMRGRGLAVIRGPTGIGMMGMGVLVDGFQHRAVMTMMGYNHPYYAALLENEGFTKYKDQYSLYIDAKAFTLPDKVRRAAEIALKRGSFTVPDFRSKKALARHAADIGRVYNEAFVSLGADYLPLTDGEVKQVTKELMFVADPSLIKLLFYKDALAGLVFGFADLSAAMQRSRGRITPWSLLDIMLEYRRTKWLIVNGAAILPHYQRLGGNALLYYELQKIAGQKRFLHADAVQVAETTSMMLSDLSTLGAKVYKTHRIYTKNL